MVQLNYKILNLLVNGRVEAVVLVGVGHVEGLPGLGYVTGDSLPDGEPRVTFSCIYIQMATPICLLVGWSGGGKLHLLLFCKMFMLKLFCSYQ